MKKVNTRISAISVQTSVFYLLCLRYCIENAAFRKLCRYLLCIFCAHTACSWHLHALNIYKNLMYTF